MKFLVTGISGFIGSHVAAALAALGHEVIGTTRRNEPRLTDRYQDGFFGRHKSGGTIRSVQADLSNREEVEKLLDDIEGIFHIAGFAWDWGPAPAYFKANVVPVEHILGIIGEKAKTLRFVIHTSSISVHGFGPQRNSSEEGPYFKPISHYQRSKIESEKLILKAAAGGEYPPMAIVRPGNVYGPGDTTTLYPMLDAIESGKMGYVNGGKSLTCPVFIDDMVSSYIQLMEKLLTTPGKVNGQIYNITGGEEISWRQETELMADAAALARPKLNAPAWLANTAAGILVFFYSLVRAKNPPDITPYRIHQVRNDYHFSIAKARNDLEWEPQTLFAEGIQPTVEAWKRSKIQS